MTDAMTEARCAWPGATTRDAAGAGENPKAAARVNHAPAAGNSGVFGVTEARRVEAPPLLDDRCSIPESADFVKCLLGLVRADLGRRRN
jgi:hypothetical protein